MVGIPSALEPGTQVGRWLVVERLGMGGQGTVYRVEDLDHPGDFYALKLARYPHDARAEREVALMMTRAAHPGVARFHGCARWPHPREGVLGFLMDLVPGQPLHLWAETGDTTFRQLVRAGGEVALTLGDLHARGVLHRDLKPEHIVIREPDGKPILLDFGVGWYEGAPPLTTGPLPPGTPHLISPEAVRFLWKSPERPGAHYAFQPTDDLYALGVCLYRAVTGYYPFPEHWPLDVLQYGIVHLPPCPPVEVNPRVPRALSEVILRLLAKQPQARYPSGAAVHEALVAAIASTGAEWDAPVFAREEAGPIRRPEPPRVSWPPPSVPRSRPRGKRGDWPWRLGLAAALLWFLMPGTRQTPEPPAPAPEWSTDARVGPTPPRREAEPRPLPNQKRAPCTPKLELEFSGACWLSLEQRPPNCPPQTVAYEDKCLLPVVSSPSIPVSVDGGAPEAR